MKIAAKKDQLNHKLNNPLAVMSQTTLAGYNSDMTINTKN